MRQSAPDQFFLLISDIGFLVFVYFYLHFLSETLQERIDSGSLQNPTTLCSDPTTDPNP